MLCMALALLWSVGNGLTPLLPVYALQLGASPTFAGYMLAFAWLGWRRSAWACPGRSPSRRFVCSWP